MPRPKPDIDAIRGRLLAAAEQMLEETDGQRLILSEVARRVGLTQSHAHSFFATKKDLVRALALRWFAQVEASVADLPGDPRAVPVRLEAYVLAILRLKRAKFDENPVLFMAYLTLARDHMDVVRVHAGHLKEVLRHILSAEVPAEDIDAATDLVWDATTAFRVPHMIAMNRADATDHRARAVVSACVVALRQGVPRVTH